MASTLAPARTGLYLYGITIADHMLCPLSGVGGADVELIAEGSLAAIVSQLAVGKVRPQRANLAAHHRILHDLAEQRPVLPVVFGTITGNEAELRRVLRQNRGALAGLLDRLRGKVEMGLKVYWDLPNVFEYFVATHQELEAMRNRLFRPGRMPTVEEKVELGERFVSLLQQARERHTRRVKEALAAYCVEVRSIDPGEERMILKLACLVEKDRQEQWEEGVRQAAMLFDDHYRFDYNGPWPPYNFADVDLKVM
ncbi:MAG: GvpL/GvpF family gas vesicle protein [Thermoguttaceae bacterium]